EYERDDQAHRRARRLLHSRRHAQEYRGNYCMSDAPTKDETAAKVDEQQDLSKAATEPKTQAEAEQRKALKDYSKVEANGELSMYVRIHSPFKSYFDGQAFSVTAENATGVFDVLPHHHNFISLLLPCNVIVRSVDDGEQKIAISGGIIHVKADRLVIFLD